MEFVVAPYFFGAIAHADATRARSNRALVMYRSVGQRGGRVNYRLDFGRGVANRRYHSGPSAARLQAQQTPHAFEHTGSGISGWAGAKPGLVALRFTRPAPRPRVGCRTAGLWLRRSPARWS